MTSTPISPRRALYLQDAHPIRTGMELSRYAEQHGFEAVWQAESRLVREATVPMAAFAAVTSRIKVGSGVCSMWTRNTGLLAATFATLADLAPGRVVCGLGAWWDPLARKVGVDRSGALGAMREVVEAVRLLFRGEEVSYAGSFVHLDGVALDTVWGERQPREIPIVIGATGPKMLELAGEIADGVLLNYMVSPDYNIGALERIRAGAARAGRDPAAIDTPQLVICSVATSRKEALDAARPMVTQYLGQQPHLMAASGVDQELLDRIGKVLTWPATQAEILEAAKLVPDEVIEKVTASGTPDEAQAAVAAYEATGCTCPVLYPLGDAELMIRTFAAQPAKYASGR